MSTTFPLQRRTLLTGIAAVGLTTLAGCMTKPLRPVNADGTYCYRVGKSYRPKLTCTPDAVPAPTVEAEAKRFEADPNALTVYVLRRRWGDASLPVPLAVDGVTLATTIPESLLRMRMPPGLHRLSASWEGRSAEITIDGKAGDVQYVGLNGSGWAWGNDFSWEPLADPDRARARAKASKLVADVDLRR